MTTPSDSNHGPLSVGGPQQTTPADSDASRSRWGWLYAASPARQDLGVLVLRVSFGLALALGHGLGKATAPAQFIQGLVKRGFPAPTFFGWAALLSELLGGLLLAAGLLTRPAAALVLITLSVAAFDIHAGAPFAKRELALAYVAVALSVLVAGPGRYSLDARLFGAGLRAS